MAKLFQMCRERFLVSNEMLLKSFLVEFKDHELLTTKCVGRLELWCCTAWT